MAREIQKYAVIIPPGTALANAIQVPLPMPARVVDEIEIIVPPGARGEVGFQVGSAGSQIIPATPGQFFVTDNEIIHWPLEEQMDSGAWQLIAYNTGAYAHTIEVRFLVHLPPAQTQPAGWKPLSSEALSSS